MEVIKSIVTCGDIIMAAITGWFLWKNVRDVDSIIGFSAMLILFLASAGLIWRRLMALCRMRAAAMTEVRFISLGPGFITAKKISQTFQTALRRSGVIRRLRTRTEMLLHGHTRLIFPMRRSWCMRTEIRIAGGSCSPYLL